MAEDKVLNIVCTLYMNDEIELIEAGGDDHPCIAVLALSPMDFARIKVITELTKETADAIKSPTHMSCYVRPTITLFSDDDGQYTLREVFEDINAFAWDQDREFFAYTRSAPDLRDLVMYDDRYTMGGTQAAVDSFGNIDLQFNQYCVTIGSIDGLEKAFKAIGIYKEFQSLELSELRYTPEDVDYTVATEFKGSEVV